MIRRLRQRHGTLIPVCGILVLIAIVLAGVAIVQRFSSPAAIDTQGRLPFATASMEA